MTMKNDIKIEEELTCHFKSDMNFSHKILPEHSKSLFFLITSFWAKYILFQQQKYRWVIFLDTEELCKFCRKTDQSFEKRHKKFGKFSPEHMKVSKLGLWWDPFVQSRKVMTLKFTKELCVTTIKNNAKEEFEEELTFHFKTGMSNLTNFGSTTWKSKKSAL